MELRVGPPKGEVDLIPASEAAWQAFEAAISVNPFPCSTIRFKDTNRHCDGIACAHALIGPRYPTEIAVVVLSKEFFAKSDEEKHLTLLHECIHLKFMCGDMRSKTVEGIERQRASESCADSPHPQFCDDRDWFACRLWNFIDEIVAETYLKSAYQNWLRPRIAYYLSMRRQTWRDLKRPAATALLPYLLFYEVLRSDLGAVMSEGTPARAEFDAKSRELEAEMRRSCPNGVTATLLQLRPMLFDVTLDPLRYDAGAHDGLFRQVMAVEPEATDL